MVVKSKDSTGIILPNQQKTIDKPTKFSFKGVATIIATPFTLVARLIVRFVKFIKNIFSRKIQTTNNTNDQTKNTHKVTNNINLNKDSKNDTNLFVAEVPGAEVPGVSPTQQAIDLSRPTDSNSLIIKKDTLNNTAVKAKTQGVDLDQSDTNLSKSTKPNSVVIVKKDDGINNQKEKLNISLGNSNKINSDASSSTIASVDNNARTNKNDALVRFITAQDDIDSDYKKAGKKHITYYQSSLEQLQNGKKETHWIWFIFPQKEGLGSSYNSQKYGLKGVDEAVQYLNNSTLAVRLINSTKAILDHKNKTIRNILNGEPDYSKFKSSMAIFNDAMTQLKHEKNIPSYLLENQDIFSTALKQCQSKERK